MALRSLIILAMATTLAGALGQAALAADKKPASPKAASSCFYSRDINGFQAVDRETVNIRVGIRDIYQLKLMGSSPDIDWTQRIALVSAGSNFICNALGTTVVVPGPSGPQRYPVSSLRKMTPAEAAAVPKKQRP